MATNQIALIVGAVALLSACADAADPLGTRRLPAPTPRTAPSDAAFPHVKIPEAATINTDGIIVPGFVDLHNHVPWNALPRWNPGRTFTNQTEWAADPEYRRVVAEPFERVSASSFCDMNAWGELRALVGGTTAIMASRQLQ